MTNLNEILTITIETMTDEEKVALYNQYSMIANLHEMELLGYVGFTKEIKKDDSLMEFIAEYANHPDIIAQVFSGYDANKKYYLFDDGLFCFDTFQELREKNGFDFDYLIITLATYTIDYEELENEKINKAFSLFYKMQCEEHKKAMQAQAEKAENEMIETISTIIK